MDSIKHNLSLVHQSIADACTTHNCEKISVNLLCVSKTKPEDLIKQTFDLDTYLEYLDKFLPYIDNWEVCDTLNPKIFKKDYNKVHKYLLNILKDKRTYYKRFAIVSLLQFYLGNNLYKKDLITLSKIKSNDYYVNMAISWYYSVALIKNYEEVVPLFENKILDKWIHNKPIQKAIESYRISDERKSYLRSLKIK